ncbi:DUF6233 domain-containing protein [Streptomyces chryseus]|uniref:DUF6233 domain-containing protein n=1 Tax=Streptomyces chryseus TaxID=68186 RepID=UPI00110F8E45|nr:DUF6233 domain-containing protein [Streptomyces chryseus]GGX40862.1 hypothetical protein GCM10010353_65280 [Streptomyces chryseus]
MSDKPSRVGLLRFLERVQLQQLDQTRRWPHAEEQRQAELAARRPPPPPDWVIQLGIGEGSPPMAMHVGGCGLGGGRTRAIDRAQALRALADGITPCPVCKPDRDLGYLG